MQRPLWCVARQCEPRWRSLPWPIATRSRSAQRAADWAMAEPKKFTKADDKDKKKDAPPDPHGGMGMPMPMDDGHGH